VRRVENSEPQANRPVAADTDLARRDFVVKLLAKVSAEDRMLLMLKEVEGYSVEELSIQTGMNENTIKVKLFRARQKLVRAAQRLDRSPGLGVG
jgi:RNA polymerase sigma-70 factor (ECF subfamily)